MFLAIIHVFLHKAFEYYSLSAEQDYPEAQTALGFFYNQGLGTEQDYEKAFQLFQRSAEQGFPVTMFAYGDCYYLGNGVEQDLKTAEEWYQKALDAGYESDQTDQEHLAEVLG